MKISSMILALLFLFSLAHAHDEFDGVLALYPATSATCVAVEIATPVGQPITGLRWFHNDASTPFPRLVLVEGQPGEPPQLDAPGLVLADLSGASLAWGDVDFDGPVISSTGTAYAVLFYPASDATHAGQGGGAALGIRDSDGAAPFYVSGDAVHWSQFDAGTELGVEAKRQLMRSRPRVLAEMEPVASSGPSDPETREWLRTRLHSPSPNPFNPRVTIAYSVAREGPVAIAVHDILGRRVSTLVDRTQRAGGYTLSWDGRDHSGRNVASGVYFVRMMADGVTHAQRVVLVR